VPSWAIRSAMTYDKNIILGFVFAASLPAIACTSDDGSTDGSGASGGLGASGGSAGGAGSAGSAGTLSTGGTGTTGGTAGSSGGSTAAGGASAGAAGTAGSGTGGGSTAILPRKKRIAVTDGASACVVSTSREIVCWGGASPDGTDFDAVIGKESSFCGRRQDGSITCWGDFDTTLAGSFGDFSLGRAQYGCALRTSDGTPECFGAAAATIPPGALSEAFVQIESGSGNVCALRANGSIGCWGSDPTAPAGEFTQISYGAGFACGINTSGTSDCWGPSGMQAQRLPPATTQLVQISVGLRGTCGILPDKSIQCWHDLASIQAVPIGTFVEVVLGDTHACGVHEDGTFVCWPEIQYTPTDLTVLLD